MAREVKHQVIKISRDLERKSQEYELPMLEMSYVVGQAAAIRFFDENSRKDFEAINEILAAKQVRNWMDDAGKMGWRDYQYWAGTHTNQSFLFSVHDSRLEKKYQIRRVRGFVNIYSGRSEKFRVKRMIKQGIVKDGSNRVFLEVSLALRPFKDGDCSGSGLMSSALRQSCLQVRSWLNYPKESDLVIYGFIDPKNAASIKAIEAAGFIKKGKARCDSTTDEDSIVYILSWRKLQKKIKLKLESALRNKMKIVMEPQKTDSHCGPAVVKALLGFNKIDVSQDEIVDAVHIRTKIIKWGMRPLQIALAVKKLGQGSRFWFKQNATAKDLEKLIHEYKIPVGIDWQGLFYDSVKEEKAKSRTKDHGHYSVVIDINTKKDKIVIDDPYSEYFDVPREFSYKWFKSRWWDTDESVNQKTKEKNILRTKKFVFVIVPKSFKFPDNMGFKGINDLVDLEKTEKLAVISP